ncbi:MAG: WD40 repeat domain-containing protein [Anaerolineales bacterium]|nr:WD40 repeat domain-containing protein [Anaerolineales bacterium]
MDKKRFRWILFLAGLVWISGCQGDPSVVPTSSATPTRAIATETQTPTVTATGTIPPHELIHPSQTPTLAAQQAAKYRLKVLTAENISQAKILPLSPKLTPAPLSVAWAADGKTVAIGTSGSFLLKDPKGDAIYERRVTYGVQAIAFSPDGGEVAFADGHNVYVFPVNAPQKETALTGHTRAVLALVFDDAGKLLASAGEDNQIIFWQDNSPQKKTVLKNDNPLIRGLAFTPDSKYLFSSSDGGAIRKWNLETQSVEREFDCACEGTTRLMRVEGILYAGTEEGWLQSWDMAEGTRGLQFDTGLGQIRSLTPHGSEGQILLAGMDGRVGILAGGRESDFRVLSLTYGAITSAASDPQGGQILIAASDHLAVTVDSISGEWKNTLFSGTPGGARDFSFNRDGTYIYHSLWSAFSRWNMAQSINQSVTAYSRISSIFGTNPWAFLPDGNLIVILEDSNRRNSLAILDPDSGGIEKIPETETMSPIIAADVDSTGKYLAWQIEGYGRGAGLLNFMGLDGQERTQWASEMPGYGYWAFRRPLALLSNRILFTAGPDGLRRYTAGKPEPDLVSQEGYLDLRLSTDEKMLAAVVAYPSPLKPQGHINIYRVSDDGNLERVQRIVGEAVSLGPRGELLATLYGGLLKVIDTTDFRELRTYVVLGEKIKYVQFSPAGDCFAALTDKNNVYIWGIPADAV